MYWPTCVDLHDPNYSIFTYMYIHAYNSVYTFIYMLHCTYKGVSAHKEEVLAYDDEWYKYYPHEGILCVPCKIISTISEQKRSDQKVR